MLKLFPGVCASQILWQFIPDSWTTHMEDAAAIVLNEVEVLSS